MTTTRAVFRSRISDLVGDWYGTLTCDSGSTTTIVDTELKDLNGGGDDDGFLNWWVICTSGNNIGEIRRISASVASSNTLTVSRAFTNAMATQTYEVHRHNPTDYHDALNRALDELFPFIYLPIRDESIVVDSWLSNGLFETFSSGFTGWTEVGSPTVTQETTRYIQGASSAKVIASGANGQLTQAPAINISTMIGKTVVGEAWAYTTSTSAGRVRLDWNGTSITSGSYHTGADQWEHLTVSGVVPEGATQVKMICEATDGTTVFFDFASLVIEPLYEYTLPTNLILGPYTIEQQYSSDNPKGIFVPLNTRPMPGLLLRIIGKGMFTTTTAETTAVEVDTPRTELVAAQAAFFLNRLLAQRAATQQRQRYLDDMKMWSDVVEQLKRIPGMRSMFIGVQLESGLLANQWHTENKTTGRVLIFDVSRGTTNSLRFSHL